MKADLEAGRVPAVGIHEIKYAERYQDDLGFKLQHMQEMQDLLNKHFEGKTVRLAGTLSELELWRAELRCIREARKYLIGAHVCYKINYVLAK